MLQLVLVLATLIGQAGPDSAHDTRGLTILDMHATWCGPCRQQRPRIAKLKEQGYPVRTVDIDADPETAKRYDVTAVPTLVMIDRNGDQIARRVGPYTATEIAAWYRKEWEKLGPAEPQPEPAAPRPPPRAERAGEIPSPWETSCRVQIEITSVVQKGYRGYGSGTVISSDGTTTIVLTCAHVFDMGNPRKLPPDQFPSIITVNLSDAKPTGDPPKAKFGKSYRGKALDYDFGKDVGLIVVSTADVLAASPIVPATWIPQVGMQVEQFGCKGADYPTSFATTIIEVNPAAPNKMPTWSGLKCKRMPGEGRSGGGLFTTDHYLCGVTDFRGDGRGEGGNFGLYAGPKSIHEILDRNGLKHLYDDAAAKPEPLVAPEQPVETTSDADIESTCLRIFKKWHRPPVPGPIGPVGPVGPRGPQGPAGTNGKDGKDATGGAPVDLTAILARLDAYEKRIKALEEEAMKPITVAVKLPDGSIKKRDFYPRKNTDGSSGIGAQFPSRAIGLDLSDYAVPPKTPSSK